MTNIAEIDRVRDASRRMVRSLGFMKPTLAGTTLSPSAVHALIEIGGARALTASDLARSLQLEKSSVSRMIRKLVAGGEVAEAASAEDGRAKLLSLTAQGRRTLARINAFAEERVGRALERLTARERQSVAAGLSLYAGALSAEAVDAGITIETGYRPGLVGRIVGLHAHHYAAHAGFGAVFEGKVAAGLGDFVQRLDSPDNGIWTAMAGGVVVGAVAIDGEDLGDGIAHLRWFILDDAWQGHGIGRRLLAEALAFCDGREFAATRLWTFAGLDAARRLYERAGFRLEAEWRGRQWGPEVLEQRFLRRAPGGDAQSSA